MCSQYPAEFRPRIPMPKTEKFLMGERDIHAPAKWPNLSAEGTTLTSMILGSYLAVSKSDFAATRIRLGPGML